MDVCCPVCSAKIPADPFIEDDGYVFYNCCECGSIFIEPEVLNAMDRGEAPRAYDQAYWEDEESSARQRAESDALVRAGQAILYSRREIRRFLDVGAGAGYLLTELSRLYPGRSNMFHGVEMFPPEQHSRHPNYVVGSVRDLEGKFDGGVCIEVIEHLTPNMLDGLIEQLSKVSHSDALWLFNTGMPDYVRDEEPGYMNLKRRGHVVSYGISGLRRIFEPHGFRVSSLPGMSFAFIAEYRASPELTIFSERFYRPLVHNKALLEEQGLLYQAAFECSRSYFFQAESSDRSRWAKSLQDELSERTAWALSLRGEVQQLSAQIPAVVAAKSFGMAGFLQWMRAIVKMNGRG